MLSKKTLFWPRVISIIKKTLARTKIGCNYHVFKRDGREQQKHLIVAEG